MHDGAFPPVILILLKAKQVLYLFCVSFKNRIGWLQEEFTISYVH